MFYECISFIQLFLPHTISADCVSRSQGLPQGRETWLRLLRKLLSWKKELWQHLQSGTMWDKKGKTDSGGRIIETGSVTGSKIWRKKHQGGKEKTQKEEEGGKRELRKGWNPESSKGQPWCLYLTRDLPDLTSLLIPGYQGVSECHMGRGEGWAH